MFGEVRYLWPERLANRFVEALALVETIDVACDAQRRGETGGTDAADTDPVASVDLADAVFLLFAGRSQSCVGGGDRHAAQAGDPLDGGVDQLLQGVAVDPCLFAVVLFLGGGAGEQVAEDSTGEYHPLGPLVGYR